MADKWKENAMKYLSERWNEKSFLDMYFFCSIQISFCIVIHKFKRNFRDFQTISFEKRRGYCI